MLSEIVGIVATIVFAAIPLLLPNRSIAVYAVWFLGVLAFYLIFLCFRLHLQIKKLKEQLDEVSSKHTTLARRFDRNRELLRRYRAGIKSIEFMLAVTFTSSKQDRFSAFYQWFLQFKQDLDSDNH